jgi:AcrR family transcriptional regulator
MLDAAARLLESEGPDAVTHLRIAEDAGVSRATVYRHWPDRVDLIVDLVAEGAAIPGLDIPEDGTATDRLAAGIRSVASILDGDGAATFLLLLSRALWDERIAEVRSRMVEHAQATLVALIEEGVETGEFSIRDTPDAVIDRLFGPVLARRLLRAEAIDDAFIDSLIDGVLD